MPDNDSLVASSSEDLEALFVSKLPFIDEVTRSICRRRGLQRSEAEDFASTVKLKLVDGNYEALRRFARGSRLETYLTAIIQRAFIDFRRKAGERWRPSRKAEQLGPVGIRIEELRHRHGHSFDEVCEILLVNEKVELSRRELAELEAQLPARLPRGRQDADGLDEIPAREPMPEERLLESERRRAMNAAWEALAEARQELSLEDRLLLKMQLEGIKIHQMARQLGVKPARIYKKLPRIRERLKKRLLARGVDAEDIF